MKSDFNYLEKELSNQLFGLFVKVGKELGSNFKEFVYQEALKEELEVHKIEFKIQPKVSIHSFKNEKSLGFFIPDILIENKIIVEIKSLKHLSDDSVNQIMKYLERSIYEIGYLVNFGCSHTQIIRRIYTNDRKKFLNNFSQTNAN